MSVALKRSGVHIEIDQESYQRIIDALRHVQGVSEEGTLAKALNQTLKQARDVLSKRAKEVYVGEHVKGIKERSKIHKARSSAPAGQISFKSEQPAITKFKYLPHSTPTTFLPGTPTRRKFFDFKSQINPGGAQIFAFVGKQKKYNVYVDQLRANSLGHKIENGFVVKFKSGHIAVAFRSSKKKKNNRYGLLQLLGSSDMAMVRNEKVFGAEKENLARYLNEQCAEQLKKALRR